MKKILYRLSTLLLAAAAFLACQREEIVETPTLKITDDAGVVALEYGQTLDYVLDLSYYQYSATANANNEILKASQFQVRSNCSWKLVPVGEAPDWIRPFPDAGDKEGVFFFLAQRNNDQTDSRQVVYQVVINDGARDIPVGGTIIVTQAAAVDFLKTNQAKLDINKEGGNSSVTVISNLPWTYALTPNADYASPDIAEWIEDRTELKEGSVSQTLRFRFADNSEGSLRGANLTITPEGHPELEKIIPITQFGLDVEITGFPVSWVCSNKAGFPTWPSASNPVPTLQASQGKGTITFHRADIPGLDRTASTCDVSGDNPRVNGAWPGDYWEFNAPSPISAGSLIKLSFEGRISGSGIKHWRLEYKDGTEWKIAGTPLTAEIAADDVWPAETITYTHDMAPGGTGDEYNKIITQIVRYSETTDEVAFRFYAASNVIASSGLRMAKPTTASTRLDNSKPSTVTNDATISCVASGGEIKLADIEVKGVDKGYLLFDGAPQAPAAISVTASDDFTVTADVPWLHITNGSTGKADEETAVEITCDDSTLSEPREGNVIVQAGVTRKYIAVIQSAAGQELDPFISVSTGNVMNVKAEEGTTKVRIQSNVDVEAISDVAWLSIEEVRTKAMVEWTDYVVTRQANDSGAPRTGTIRFVNTEKNVEAVVTFNQEYEEPVLNNNLIQWGFSANLMSAYKDSFEKDNAFEANVEGKGTISWTDLAENIALDVNSKKSHLIGTTGQPYVTGVWPGDYWQFTIPANDSPKGTVVHFQAKHRISGTGQKYWRMDWSEDGTTWTPVKALQTETETGNSAQYTHIAPTSDVLLDETFTLANGIEKGNILIRFTCVANWQGNGSGALAAPNGGTHRWSGAEADGPKITVEKPHDPLHAEWLFTATAMADPDTGYAATFGGTTAVNDKKAGDGGLYVASNVTKGGKITYVQVDKTTIDTDGKAARLVGGTGHPYVNGAWPGDYWLFEAADGYSYPAGTKVHIKFITRISAAGHKYWKLEYWDGAAWQPVSELQNGSVGEGEAVQTFQYNFEPTTATSNSQVDHTWTLAAACDKMQFRYVCMANWPANGNGALAAPNGGTCRIAGADGTSPIFEVVTE